MHWIKSDGNIITSADTRPDLPKLCFTRPRKLQKYCRTNTYRHREQSTYIVRTNLFSTSWIAMQPKNHITCPSTIVNGVELIFITVPVFTSSSLTRYDTRYQAGSRAVSWFFAKVGRKWNFQKKKLIVGISSKREGSGYRYRYWPRLQSPNVWMFKEPRNRLRQTM
jgi:hypothetical protein